MKTKTSIKYKIGLTLISISFILPLFGFVVPFLGFSTAVTAFIVGIFVVGTPDLCLFLGIILAGKEAAELIKQKFFRPAGKVRYTIGIIMAFTSVLTNWVTAYLDVSNLMPLSLHAQLYLMASLDLLLIFSVFIMGPEFFTKFKNLFVWEGVKRSNQ